MIYNRLNAVLNLLCTCGGKAADDPAACLACRLWHGVGGFAYEDEIKRLEESAESGRAAEAMPDVARLVAQAHAIGETLRSVGSENVSLAEGVRLLAIRATDAEQERLHWRQQTVQANEELNRERRGRRREQAAAYARGQADENEACAGVVYARVNGWHGANAGVELRFIASAIRTLPSAAASALERPQATGSDRERAEGIVAAPWGRYNGLLVSAIASALADERRQPSAPAETCVWTEDEDGNWHTALCTASSAGGTKCETPGGDHDATTVGAPSTARSGRPRPRE